MARKVRDGIVTASKRALDIPTEFIPGAVKRPLLLTSSIAMTADLGLAVYGAVTSNTDILPQVVGNMALGDTTLIAAAGILEGSTLYDSKLMRLSRLAGLSEAAMSIAGNYLLRTGDLEKGAQLLFATLILEAGHSMIQVALCQKNRHVDSLSS